MSMAIIASIPFLVSCEIFDPICGRASIIIAKANAPNNRPNFNAGLVFEASGIKSRINAASPNFLNLAVRRRMATIYMITSNGRTSNSHKYAGSSNLNILLYCYGMRRNTVILNNISQSRATIIHTANGWKASYFFENLFTSIFVFSSLSISL